MISNLMQTLRAMCQADAKVIHLGAYYLRQIRDLGYRGFGGMIDQEMTFRGIPVCLDEEDEYRIEAIY
jgi:hypothetical protein